MYVYRKHTSKLNMIFVKISVRSFSFFLISFHLYLPRIILYSNESNSMDQILPDAGSIIERPNRKQSSYQRFTNYKRRITRRQRWLWKSSIREWISARRYTAIVIRTHFDDIVGSLFHWLIRLPRRKSSGGKKKSPGESLGRHRVSARLIKIARSTFPYNAECNGPPPPSRPLPQPLGCNAPDTRTLVVVSIVRITVTRRVIATPALIKISRYFLYMRFNFFHAPGVARVLYETRYYCGSDRVARNFFRVSFLLYIFAIIDFGSYESLHFWLLSAIMITS